LKRNQKTQSQRIQKEKFIRQQFPQVHPKGENQKIFLDALRNTTLVIAAGSAGTGKTFLACYTAAKKLHNGEIKKIILLRAYQPLAGRSIGFLPGTAEEKLMPYYQQMLDYFEDILGKGTVEVALKNRVIEICFLETIRGRSWDDSFIIVDESQNLYVPEIQALTTRVGSNSQMIFCGDNSGIQTDIRKGTTDGLSYLRYITDKYNIQDVAFVQFTRDDIVRSDITRDFVIAFVEELIEEEKSKVKTKGAKA
jgi:phosphate starvation-inducible PhoH-like protein